MSGNQAVAIPLGQRIVTQIESLRELAKEYKLLDDNQKKAIRAECHRRQGKFSKTLFPAIDEFIEHETTLINEGKA